MRRREIITLVGGAAVAWPLATRAQQSDRIKRVGVLSGQAASDSEGQARLAAFLQGLQELGWSVGRNLRIDVRRYEAARQSFLASTSHQVTAEIFELLSFLYVPRAQDLDKLDDERRPSLVTRCQTYK
jgi:hypothetical protein